MPPRKSPGVFINAPFDARYAPILEAIIFAVTDCGFSPHTALEIDDGAQIRFEKICRIMANCDYGIHDISRTEVERSKLPRFNMPLELGLFLGATRFGNGRQRAKNCLILDRERFRYQQFCSDIAGQDIRAHSNKPDEAIARVRDWLSTALSKRDIVLPGRSALIRRFAQFQRDLPEACRQLKLRRPHLTYSEFGLMVRRWQKKNPI